MPLLYNHTKGHVENVPEEAVDQAVAGGQYTFRKQSIIPVIAPDGAETTIDAADATAAFANGYRYITKDMSKAIMEEKTAAARQEAFGDTAGEISAFGLGAARGLTMGLSDVALGAADKLGLSGLSEAVKQTEQYNPTASTAGEITGSIAGLAVGASPVAQVAKLGSKITAKAAATGAVKALGKSAPIVAKMAAAGAGSAVEGALYSAGEVLGEASLGDPGFTAEGAIASVGLGGLFGGAFGGLVPGAGEAFKQSKKIMADLTKPVVEQTGQTAAHLAGKLVTVTRGLEGKVKKDIEKVFEASTEGAALRAKVAHYDSNPEDLLQNIQKTVTTLDEIGKEQIDLAVDVRKWARESDAISTLSPKEAKKSSKEALKSLSNVADEISADPIAKAGIAKDLRAFIDEAKDKISKAESAADVHYAMERTRVDFDKQFKKYYKQPTSATDIRNAEKLSDAREIMQKHLIDENVYGEFAKDYGQFNKAMSEFYGARDQFQASFYGKAWEEGKQKRGLLATKIAGAFTNPERKEVQHDAINYLVDRIDNLKSNLDDIATRRGLPVEQFAEIPTGKLLTHIDDIRELRSVMLTLNRLESSTGKALAGMVAGGMLGSGLALASSELELDMPTSIAGVSMLPLIGWTVGNPKFLMKTVSRFERGNNAVLAGINNAAKKLAGASIQGISSGDVTKQVMRLSIGNAAQQLGAEIGKSHPVEALSNRINELLSSAVALDESMSSAMPGADSATPMTYAAMTQTARKALEYVQTKIPAPIQEPGMMKPAKQRLNKSEEIRLERTISAAFNPAYLLKEIDSGVVHPETVDAVRTVYPYFFQTMQTQIMEAVTQPDSKLDMNKAIQLSRITGMPTNISLAGAGSLNAAWGVDEFAGEKFRPGAVQTMGAQGPNNLQTEAQKLSTPL